MSSDVRTIGQPLSALPLEHSARLRYSSWNDCVVFVQKERCKIGGLAGDFDKVILVVNREGLWAIADFAKGILAYPKEHKLEKLPECALTDMQTHPQRWEWTTSATLGTVLAPREGVNESWIEAFWIKENTSSRSTIQCLCEANPVSLDFQVWSPDGSPKANPDASRPAAQVIAAKLGGDGGSPKERGASVMPEYLAVEKKTGRVVILGKSGTGGNAWVGSPIGKLDTPIGDVSRVRCRSVDDWIRISYEGTEGKPQAVLIKVPPDYHDQYELFLPTTSNRPPAVVVVAVALVAFAALGFLYVQPWRKAQVLG